MSPPSATGKAIQTNGDYTASAKAPLEPAISENRAAQQMPKFPSPPKFENKYEEREYLKGRLAAAFRIFGKFGFDEGVAGHITVRDPVDPSTYWVNPFGVAFSLMKRSDLIQVDHDGKVVGGGPCKLLNTAAFLIHGAVHQARPDVTCAAHSHSIYGRSFCTLGKNLDMITQDSCSFYSVSNVEQITGQKDSRQIRTLPYIHPSTASFSPTRKVKRLHKLLAIRKRRCYKIMVF